jgi:L-ascorbate metabolism protein UlaG (beta-lactamase superfamily)
VVSPPVPLEDRAAVTFIGHATFLIQAGGRAILIDPVFSMRAGPFGTLGPRRVRMPGVALGDLPRIDLVLVSHNHYDHFDKPTLRHLARDHAPAFVTPPGNGAALRRLGARDISELDWWESADVRGTRVTVTPAQHFSARTPLDRNRALWGGFVLGVGSQQFYHAGDTAYMSVFRDIRQRFGAVDVAMLPIGAYEPRWFMKAVHMNPDEAVQAHIDLEARLSIASHFGTFRLTAEGIDAPVTALYRALDARDIDKSRFRVCDVGATVLVAENEVRDA